MELRDRVGPGRRAWIALVVAAAVASSAAADERSARWPLLGGALVASSRPAESWGRGPIRIDQGPSDNDANLITAREVDEARLPSSLRRLRGLAVWTLDDDERPCRATIDGFRLLAFADAPAEAIDRWQKVAEPRTPGADEERPRLAALAWRHSRRFLMASLKSDCNPGVWAMPAATAPPARFEREEPSASLREAVTRAWVALPQYAALDRAWRRSPREMPDGTRAEPTYVEHRPPQVTRFVLGNRVLVVARALDELPCWPFRGALWAVWRVTGDAGAPRLELVHAGRKPHPGFEPKSVFLVDELPLIFVDWKHGRSAFAVRDGALVRDAALELSLGDDTFVCKK